MRKSEKRVMGFQHERKAMRKTHYCASTPPNVSPPPRIPKTTSNQPPTTAGTPPAPWTGRGVAGDVVVTSMPDGAGR